MTTDELSIDWYGGPREALRALFEEAEDSQQELDRYLHDGRVLVARLGRDIVGHVQLISQPDRVIELKNMAVQPGRRGGGIGRSLVSAAVARLGAEGVRRIVVSTATADVGNLRFYQRSGFRFDSVERDAFTPETGYPEPIDIDGIELRDRVWLSLDIAPA